ncbi:MAG: GNAT family N-acetyltransferase [Aureispira sp.]|nr:GNAT family N-acetyltransferase [Aureispira sp.]
MQLLPYIWTSTQLVIQDLSIDTITATQEVYDSCRYLLDWEGRAKEYSPTFISQIYQTPELPPNGILSNARLQTVLFKNKPIGFLELYHGYPSPNTLWIGTFLIHKDFQQQGFGIEVISQLCIEVQKLGFQYIELGVALKNWPGIRFWTKLGFDRIKRHWGHKVYSSDNFAGIVLEKSLNVK